jgi:hypothetical protein
MVPVVAVVPVLLPPPPLQPMKSVSRQITAKAPKDRVLIIISVLLALLTRE